MRVGDTDTAEDGYIVIERRRSPEFVACLRLLRDLNRCIAGGLGDSAQANAIRNQMEEPYAALTEGEQHLLDLVSVAIRQVDAAQPGLR